MMNRRDFFSATSSIILFAISGCMTTKLFIANEYWDTVSAFLISQDENTFVVLGDKYHYIFDISSDQNLKQVLMGTFRTAIVANLSRLYVTYDGVITGDYRLSMNKNATNEEREAALKANFTSDRFRGLALSGHLKGTRYSAEGFPAMSEMHKFNHPYTVQVLEQQRPEKKAAKILLTPITLAADGTLVIGGIIFFTVFIMSVAVQGHE